MGQEPLLVGEELYTLIPQRNPIVMVDTYFCANEESAETGFHVQSDNIFCEGGFLREPGMIEHVAQSAAVFAGYASFTKGESPRLGFIGEVKKFKIVRLPKVGEFLYTRLRVLGEAAGVTLVSAETKSGEEVLATCQMKIFIKED